MKNTLKVNSIEQKTFRTLMSMTAKGKSLKSITPADVRKAYKRMHKEALPVLHSNTYLSRYKNYVTTGKVVSR